MHNSVRVGTAIYNQISMKDVLVALAKKIPRKDVRAPNRLRKNAVLAKHFVEFSHETLVLVAGNRASSRLLH
jgi:TPP-dependent 2-oxoacid decarboxylase